MRAIVRPSGASRTVAIIAESKITRCTGNSVGAQRRHEQAAVRMRGRIEQDDAHALAARELAEFGQHDVERAIDFAGGQQRAIDFTEHLERAPVALQVHRGGVELALQRRELLTALRGSVSKRRSRRRASPRCSARSGGR